ncbi:hypothetical protein ACFU99_37095, partial [Streptomyces sp. NPDC057654]
MAIDHGEYVGQGGRGGRGGYRDPDAYDYDGYGHGHGGYGPPERAHRVPAVLRAPLEGRTWREFLYLVLSLPIAVVGFSYATVMVQGGYQRHSDQTETELFRVETIWSTRPYARD